MNDRFGIEVQGSGRGLFKISESAPGGAKENHEIPSEDIRSPDRDASGRLCNAGQTRYRLSQLAVQECNCLP